MRSSTSFVNQYSDDERINMKLRLDAGESIVSIAEDYDTKTDVIKICTDPEFRERRMAKRREADRLRRAREKAAKQLLKQTHPDVFKRKKRDQRQQRVIKRERARLIAEQVSQ